MKRRNERWRGGHVMNFGFRVTMLMLVILFFSCALTGCGNDDFFANEQSCTRTGWIFMLVPARQGLGDKTYFVAIDGLTPEMYTARGFVGDPGDTLSITWTYNPITDGIPFACKCDNH